MLLASVVTAAEEPAVDRRPSTPLVGQRVERAGGGFFGDFFRLGKPGEVWMIDAIRLWFVPPRGPACGRELGDSIEKITLLGAIDNPPVPGQPACDCHALVSLAAIHLDRGSSQPRQSAAKLTQEGEMWRVDFPHVKWSIPAAADALFSLRATPRAKSGCAVEESWSLGTIPAPAGFRLHLLDPKGVPAGLAAEESARAVAIQVWANRWQ